VQWNSVPEIISTFVLFVIFINSRVTHTMPSSRERLFRFILIYSISSFILNIISVWTITSYQEANRLFSLIINSAYFFFYPLITPLFIIYILLYIYEHIPEEHYYRIKATFGAIIVSTAAYLIFVGVALKYNLLFYLDETNYYHRGTLNMVPILMSIFHIIIASFVAIRERHYLDRFFFQAVSWVPLLSLGIVIIQKNSPALYQALGIFLPLITTNCAVLGIAIMNINENYNLMESFSAGVAAGLGFTLALILMSNIRERLDLHPVRKAYSGVPIAFISGGLMALAFMAFDKSLLTNLLG
jgi:Na+-translocating ferredoxin:NAD+ oxidoreductase RnfA subunit